jgi:hypothetical protein
MRSGRFVYVVVLMVAFTSAWVLGQGQRGGGPPQPMSFFVTSVGLGNGANLGGLAGADAHCQKLGEAAGRSGVTWRAYLSTQGPNAAGPLPRTWRICMATRWIRRGSAIT